LSEKQEGAERRLSVTSLSQFVRLENCERYLRFRLCPKEARALLKRWGLTEQPLTPLLKESGSEFETGITGQLATYCERLVDMEGQDTAVTEELLRQVRQPTILLQPSVTGRMRGYVCDSRADVIRLERDRHGGLKILIADIKASRHERMEHRLQVAMYAHIVRDMAQAAGQVVAEMQGAVICLDEDGSMPSLDLESSAFDLETYWPILDHLAFAPDSIVERVLARPFNDVPYHLGYKCDGCMYNAICMVDSAERLDLSLVPYLTAAEKRVLQGAGVTSLPELATLMEYPLQGSSELTPSVGREDQVAALANQWPVGPNLPLLVQRARRACTRLGSRIEAKPYLLGAGFGSLPSDEEHPQLVKVFFDAQHDYLQDRIYMLAALIVGPKGERPVVRLTDGPPTHDSERDLLIQWVSEVIAAMRAVAAAPQAPVHLYCYNRYDQRVLLDALKRHLEDVAALPAFFDLMTESPALDQPIISFLASEIEERSNLGLTCNPLHDAARYLGFDWSAGEHEFYRLFRAKLFDNRRYMIRGADGRLVRATSEEGASDPRRASIEAASRFNSQVPLEYAYGVWGQLPQGKEESRLLDPYRQVSREQLLAFAAHRTRALAHIEGSFKYKARFMAKPPLDLPALGQMPKTLPPLSRSLEEFLYMEHHAALQAKLLTYGLPIERRVLTGLALLLRYSGEDDGAGSYRFGIEFEALGLDPVLTMDAFRLKEGAWVVINAQEPHKSASQIKHGRLAMIRGIGTDWIELELLGITFGKNKFRYYHQRDLEPEAGLLYTLDEMADDMNADKALEALHNAESNQLYRWLVLGSGTEVGAQADPISSQFVGLVDTVEGTRRPTARQGEVIGKRHAESLLLVQGPPGTGKSQTVAWAVLSRLVCSQAQGRPFRVAVSCKTHNAVNIVLGAIASKLRRLEAFQTGLTKGLDAQVYKLVNEAADGVPAGVVPLDCYHCDAEELEDLLVRRLVVIGGTPGGLYNLGRYRQTGGRKVDWSAKAFDLVVIDEASQMSLPEGILACAFLKEEGKVIVVGDHRQMPPIVAHAWEDEEKRSVTSTRPYVSLFEALKDRAFPCVSLDESFRLHKVIAEFLKDNVYVMDGIDFYSHRKEVLPAVVEGDEFVRRVLDPNYPLVVIEHDEEGSQQYNNTEVELIAPLIEACARQLGLDGASGIGVVVPHRAQRARLRERFPELAVTESIDTVERFQGGERDVIIVSATASDPDYVLAEADFLLNLNRLNVALSRPRKKLIVVASRSVIELLTSDLDVFDNAVIWKRLYHQWCAEEIWIGRRGGVQVHVHGKRAA